MSTGFANELARFGPGCLDQPVRLSQAQAYCQALTHNHYENFSVASLLLPRRLLPHFHAIYAYCRWADDLADEVPQGAQALDLLAWWRQELLLCYQGQPRHPVMVALQPTIRRFRIPQQPFLDLLLAFEHDQRVKRYDSHEELLAYCRHSANPVGHLVLYLAEAFDARAGGGCRIASAPACNWPISGKTWPAISPSAGFICRADDRQRFGYADEDLAGRRFTPAFAALLQFEVERTRQLFHQGLPLVELMPADLKVDIELFARGGLAILRKIEQAGYNVWARRPALAKWEKGALLLGVLGRRLRGLLPVW